MKWTSWTNAVLGLWLIVAPFALAYVKVQNALYEDVAIGLVITTLALWRATAPEVEEMVNVGWMLAIAGLWAFMAPFVLGYSAVTAAAYNDAIVGVAVAILAFARIVAGWQHGMPHHAALRH